MSPQKRNTRTARDRELLKATTRKVSPVVRRKTDRRSAAVALDNDARFDEVVALIDAARGRAYEAVNSELVMLYWQLGSTSVRRSRVPNGAIEDLAAALARRFPGLRGFARANLFRMRQFYDAYRGNSIVSPLVRQLPWTHHLIILGQAKPPEAREFYILPTIKERWTKRELERQIRSGAVLRNALGKGRVSAAVAQAHPTAVEELKNAYNLEFLGLADGHSEADLHGALLRNLGRFISELGRDFCFVGSEYPLQVGNQDAQLAAT